MDWQYNEWQGDERHDDKAHASIEALRAIADQLERLNVNLENIRGAINTKK